MDAEEAKVMEELERICNEAEESLQSTLTSIKETQEYSVLINETNKKGNKHGSRLMELNIAGEMNKQVLLMEELNRKTVMSLKIDWDYSQMKLSFTKPLINGAPVPYDITFSNVTCTDVDISWKYDDTRTKELKYVVEMRGFGRNEWDEVYSGIEKKCIVSGLDIDTEHNVRIKCVSKDLDGEWSAIATIRTNKSDIKINSVILSGEANGNYFLSKLTEWLGTENFELLYRGTRDGFDASDFHWKCDSQGKTLTLIKNTCGHIFGGYASIPWRRPSFGANKRAPGSFLFTLTNMYGVGPTRFPLKNERDGGAVHHEITYGPVFGDCNDLIVKSDCNVNYNSFTNFPTSYKDSTWKGFSIFTSDTESNHFQVQEIEVFRVISY